ncbi:alpha/beta fold hydrolase [Nocardia sp. NPDC006982]
MGLSSQLIHWPLEIVDHLGERGYRVIRPDNRDSSLTEWKTTPSQYYLRAVARDAVELLDHLGIERTHVVGASMGGMVAQLLAIEHTPRVLSLCSIMSTPHFLIGMADGNVLELVKPMPPDRAAAIEQITDLRMPRTRSSRSPAARPPTPRSPTRPTCHSTRWATTCRAAVRSDRHDNRRKRGPASCGRVTGVGVSSR